MAERHVLFATPGNRDTLHKWVDRACALPVEKRLTVTFSDTRTAEQNAKMQPMLRDIARQVPWHGLMLSADDWKLILMGALSKEMRIVPNVDGDGFINLGRSSSRLSKAEFSDLIEQIYAFGAECGVAWSDPAERQAA
jgi:hypothetical protein